MPILCNCICMSRACQHVHETPYLAHCRLLIKHSSQEQSHSHSRQATEALQLCTMKLFSFAHITAIEDNLDEINRLENSQYEGCCKKGTMSHGTDSLTPSGEPRHEAFAICELFPLSPRDRATGHFTRAAYLAHRRTAK